MSYNSSQQGFHGFVSQIFVTPHSLPQYLLYSFSQFTNESAPHFAQPTDQTGSTRTRHRSNNQTIEFAKALTKFNSKIQNSEKRTTTLAKLWSYALRRLLSGVKTVGKSIEGANMAVREVEQGDALEEVINAIQISMNALQTQSKQE